MNSAPQYQNFQVMDAHDKVDFLDDFIEADRSSLYTVQQLKLLLQSIIIQEPNPYLQRQALEVYSSLVLRQTLKGQSLAALLTEDISEDANPFVQITQLRLLFLHYDASKEASGVFERLTHHLNADVASEAFYRKGLLLFLALPLHRANEFTARLQECRHCFSQAKIIAENRVDAKYYATICELILALIADEQDAYAALLETCLSSLWNLNLYSSFVSDFHLESRIGIALSLLVNIVSKVNQQSDWVNYQLDLNEVFELHQKLMSLEVESNLIEKTSLAQFKQQVSAAIISPIYQNNLIAASSKILVLLNQEQNPEFSEFLRQIYESLNQESNKKKDSTQLIALLSRRFASLSIADIVHDVSVLQSDNLQDLVSLIAAYAETNATYSITGYPQGDEIFKRLHDEIIALLPNYPKGKLNSFAIVLSNVIAYVVRSMQDKREFFPELYNPALAVGRTEHVFQESLYRNLRQSSAGSRYLYEPNQSGGGRIDVTYNDGDLVFPLEVKRTANLPSWDGIKLDYLAQAQTYANAYDQLGIFVVFDLSVKNASNSPVNDIRELFKFQILQGHYALGNNFPNGVVCIIVPANKVSPSSMSVYR